MLRWRTQERPTRTERAWFRRSRGDDVNNRRQTELEERISALEKRATRAESEDVRLSRRLVALEEDALPSPLDPDEAARTINLLLGTSRVEMNKDVEALLWTHVLRGLGVLSRKEYQRRKKRLLSRDAPPSAPVTTPSGDNEKQDEAASTGATPPQSQQDEQ